MALRHVWIASLTVSLTIAGCLFDRTAEQIAQMRTSGNPEAAKEKARDVLGDDPSKMDVWRELAASELDLARESTRSFNPGEEPLANLTEAALICGAYSDFREGKPDRQWKEVCIRVAIELSNRAMASLGGLTVGDPAVLDRFEQLGQGRKQAASDDDDLVIHPREKTKTPSSFLDPSATGEHIYQAVLLAELMRHLPSDDASRSDVTLRQLDQMLAYMASSSGSTVSLINENRDAARKAAKDALAAVKSDLVLQGNFSLTTLAGNKLL